MQTITIDLLNEKVLHLLKDLEQLKLIRLRKEKKTSVSIKIDFVSKYKGAMHKQPIKNIGHQLKDLRNAWQ